MILLAGGLILIVSPERTTEIFRRFPRSRTAAAVLTAVDLAWVALIVMRAPLGRFEFLKPYVIPASVVAFGIVFFFVDELLAPRALGGFLLLAGDPVLDAARWNPSYWRLAVVALVYLWVIAGMWLVLSPWRFRLCIEKLVPAIRMRIAGGVLAAAGGLVGGLALGCY